MTTNNESMLVQELKDVVYSYAGKMSIASAIGCIKIALHEIERDLLD